MRRQGGQGREQRLLDFRCHSAGGVAEHHITSPDRADARSNASPISCRTLRNTSGSFNQLNGLYTVRDPGAKTTGENEQLLRALAALHDFMYSFDFLKMHPDKSFVQGGVPLGTFARGMSEPGRQYAWYHHHSTFGRNTASYKVTPGTYREDVVLHLPAGAYQADWVDTATGSVIRSESFTHAGGDRTLATPGHAVDIALRVKLR